ncbi:hypothetical protein BKA62DRAFT_39113 [Auriculariales sp. MPI-PUGE-AT-0066]|nr:hypothetical protein BKA62DRAFT_39113 [Auriculariales sp. MPI-PUGE-AT-0066]
MIPGLLPTPAAAVAHGLPVPPAPPAPKRDLPANLDVAAATVSNVGTTVTTVVSSTVLPTVTAIPHSVTQLIASAVSGIKLDRRVPPVPAPVAVPTPMVPKPFAAVPGVAAAALPRRQAPNLDAIASDPNHIAAPPVVNFPVSSESVNALPEDVPVLYPAIEVPANEESWPTPDQGLSLPLELLPVNINL